MRIRFGHDKSGKPVELDTRQTINAHMQVSGVTGMGKTYFLQEAVTSFVESASELGRPVRVHVFDPHGDIELPFSSVVKFSEGNAYGYNPLEVNPHPDYGGVRRAIQKFIAAVNKQKRLGTKQEAAMRYLLEDLYTAHGFKIDDAQTWIPDDPRMVRAAMQGREHRVYLDVAFEHRERFKELAKGRRLLYDTHYGFDDFDNDAGMRTRKCWWVDRSYYDGDFLMWEPKKLFKAAPTLDDLVRFTERRLKAQFCGTNSAAMALLKDVNTAARSYHRKVDELARRDQVLDEAERVELMKGLDAAKEKATLAYTSYLDAIVTGRELDDMIRYNSVDVLTSVYERVQNLGAIGIYNANPPPFDPSKPIWQYQILPLEYDVQRMLADLVAAKVLERRMHQGKQDDVVELLVFDEGRRFVGDEADDIFNKIANEARKFGLGLWIMSQTPEHFPDDFIKATGTIVVIGLAPADTKLAARKLGVEERMLTAVVPQVTALVQMKKRGVLTSEYTEVVLG